MKKIDEKMYVSTKEVKDKLKVNGCSVMHLRTEGKLRFKKRGNAYLYLIEDVQKLVK